MWESLKTNEKPFGYFAYMTLSEHLYLDCV